MVVESSDLRDSSRQGWLGVGLWGVAAFASIVALVIAIVGGDRGDGGVKADPDAASLRPMTASESMSDEQAFAVAANTVRVWMRERNARHLANVQALACPETQDGVLGHEIKAVKGDEFFKELLPVDKIARFTRDGSVWTVDAFRSDGGVGTFTLQVRNGELLVCQIGSAPVP